MEAASKKNKIIIADSQFLIAEGLHAVLKDKFEITSIVFSAEELLHTIHEKTADILIIDYSLSDQQNTDLIKEIRSHRPELSIIVLSNVLTFQDVQALNHNGICHILHKSADREELDLCIQHLLKGKKYFSEYVLDLMFQNKDKKSPYTESSQLTPSELEIVRLISDGMTNKEIAVKKCLSIHTIMTHRKNILRKLGVSNASELIMAAIKRGYIDTIEYHI